tara:strand:- start:568 stop:1257 length:690 start_codon:yes stop_codon:yes gene_type:complete
MNDYLDVKSDKINHPKRPLVNDKIKPYNIRIIFFVLLALLIYASSFINIKSIYLLYIIILPGLFFYNLIFKKILFFGNFIISVLLGLVFVFTELVLTNDIVYLYIPFFLATCFSFVREIIKDMADFDGDLAVNMNTMPIVFGIGFMKKFITVLIILLMAILLIPYFLFEHNIKYLISLILFVEIPLIYSLFLLVKFPTKKTYKRLTVVFKVLCISGLIVIMFSKIYLYV